jgi:ribosomal protein S18 acetylase RimI-like enzyme
MDLPRPASMSIHSGVVVRKAVGEDAPAIARVLRASFAEFEGLYTPGGYSATVLDPEGVRLRLVEGPAWVAVIAGHIAGTASIVRKGESDLYVRGVAVVPQARRCGVAAALLSAVERFARQEQCPRLFLTTAPFLDSAIRLYERTGYKRVLNGEEDLFGTPLFTMEKKVNC